MLEDANKFNKPLLATFMGDVTGDIWLSMATAYQQLKLAVHHACCGKVQQASKTMAKRGRKPARPGGVQVTGTKCPQSCGSVPHATAGKAAAAGAVHPRPVVHGRQTHASGLQPKETFAKQIC